MSIKYIPQKQKSYVHHQGCEKEKEMKKLIGIALTILLVFSFVITTRAAELEKMKITCYCPESCSGTITASGTEVREGIAATAEHFGDCAMIYYQSQYSDELVFLGYFECLDKLGTGSPYVVDIWMPNMARAKHIMMVTKGTIYVKWIEKPQG